MGLIFPCRGLPAGGEACRRISPLMDYNKTINLPRTDFPMRAGLPAREPAMLERWEGMDLYHELLKKNEGRPRYALHDGPPFSNGALHMGHALNKSIKDFMVRSAATRPMRLRWLREVMGTGLIWLR